MKRILLFMTFCLLIISAKAQDFIPVQDSIKKDEDRIFMIVDQMPEFPGGEVAMQKYISENLKYPNNSIMNNIQGTVIVSFVIEKDGSISNIKVIKSVSKELDEETVRLISTMPNWTPGKQKGKPTRVMQYFPVKFKLQ